MSQDELKAKEKEEIARAFLSDIIRKTFEGISQLNEMAAETVLKNTCRACVKSSLSFLMHNYGYDPEKADLDAFIEADDKLEKRMAQGRASVTREGNIITFVSKPGECVCPLVRNYKLVQPSSNLCLCTKNYFEAQYRAAAKRPVRVELIESYNRGGNSCTFKIELL